MRRVVLQAFLAGIASPAYAQSSVGERVSGFVSDIWSPIFFLIAFGSLAIGIVVLAKGLVRLKEAGDAHARGSVGEAAARLFAGAMLIALPEAAGIGVTTWTGTDYNLFGTSGELASISRQLDLEAGSAGGRTDIMAGVSFTTPENCLAGGADDPVVCMARNVAKNAVPVAIMAAFALVFLVGLWTLASSLHAIAKMQAGSGMERSLPQGWAAKFALSVLMLNAPFLFTTISNTIFGTGGVVGVDGFDAGSSLLSYSYFGQDQSSIFKKFEELLGYCLTILAFFGVWAFVHGIFVVKATAEGKQGGTYANGFVFMFGGVLLTNAKITTCTVLYTVGGTGGTLGFCS